MLAAPQILDVSHAQASQKQAFRLKILEAEQVLEHLQDSAFQDAWNELYAACSWATAFQSWGFIHTWYRLNAPYYAPLLAIATDGNTLVGILALAIPLDATGARKGNSLVAAGHNDAEYHGWLSTVAHCCEFMQKTFQTLLSQFPGYHIKFRYLPAGTPTDWADHTTRLGYRCVLQASSRPLMRMHDPAVHKLFKKRGFKLKLNRLKRIGEVHFEQIHDTVRFHSILPQLITQYEFRQGAMFNKTHFMSYPQRLELLKALFDLHLLHVTVLWLNEEVIASVVAISDKNWLHLGGINTHSPHYAAHSPGFVHFLLLGQYLAEHTPEMVFDLTPGGDSYKENMATEHDTVSALVVTKSLSYTLKRLARRWVHYKVQQHGYSTDRVDAILKRIRYDLKTKGLRSIFNRKKKNLVVPEICWRNTTIMRPTQWMPIQKNNLEDLLCYTYRGTGKTKWEFLEDAMRNFDTGISCYTYCEDHDLKMWAWASGIDARPEAICLEDIHVTEDNPEAARCFLQTLCNELQNKGFVQIMAKSAANRPEINQILASTGFQTIAVEEIEQL